MNGRIKRWSVGVLVCLATGASHASAPQASAVVKPPKRSPRRRFSRKGSAPFSATVARALGLAVSLASMNAFPGRAEAADGS